MSSTSESAIPTVARLSPQDARAALRAQAQRLREALDKATPEPWEVDSDSRRSPDECGAYVEPVIAQEPGAYRLFDTFNRGYKVSLIEQLGDDGKWDDVSGYNDLDLAVKAVNSARAAALAFETLADARCDGRDDCHDQHVPECLSEIGKACKPCAAAVRVAEALSQ